METHPAPSSHCDIMGLFDIFPNLYLKISLGSGDEVRQESQKPRCREVEHGFCV